TARAFFKVLPRDFEALPRDFRADHETHPQTERLDVVGEPLPGEVGALVERIIRTGTRQVGAPLVAVHFLERTPRATVVAYSLVPPPGDAKPTLVGFAADAHEFAPIFDRIVQRVPMLPPTLLKRVSDRPYLDIRVTGPADEPVYQSPRFAPSPYL